MLLCIIQERRKYVKMMTVITIEIKVENMKFYLQTGHIKTMLFSSFRYEGWKSEIEVFDGTSLL